MPKMFVHAPAGLFDAASRRGVAAALTDLGMECEELPDVPAVRGNVWVQFLDHPAGTTFSGGAEAEGPRLTLVVYALLGGLTTASRQRLISGATAILGRHAGLDGQVPAYVVVHEIPEASWGMFGETVSLEKMRASRP